MAVYSLNSQGASLYTGGSTFSKNGTNYINVNASGTTIYLDSITQASSGTQVYINQNNNSNFSIEISAGNISPDSSAVYNANTNITIINYETTDGRNISFRVVGDFLNLGPSIESGSHYVQKNLTDIVPKTGDYYEITACFLAGTMISTVDGELPVEDVQEGALLRAYSGEGAPAAPVRVVWVGKSHAVVRSSDHDDVAGYPVRVLQNAIAEGVPAQDMLVTAEHCLFQEGAFVPVRMLVNGTSIFYDKSILSYDYYHIETEEHAIIEANGTLTESYLDTGNRHSFRQIAGMSRIGGTGLLWERDAAAPLKTDMAFVEPIFRRIEARAEACGYLPRQKQVSLTQDPGLHLVTDNGHVIRESRQVDGYTTFRLPAGVKSVRIVSRVSRPCDVVGPFLDDRRLMGVAVVQIKLFDDGKPHVLSSYRQQEILSGWCSVDAGETRWTSGDALLPLEGRVSGVFTQLAIQIVAGGPYAVHDTVDMADVLNA